MTTNNELSYDRPAVVIDKKNAKLTIRASAASDCRRKLAYVARGYTVSNPPDDIAINRMLAGNYLEAVAIDYLKRTGWTNVKSFTDDYDATERPNLRINLTNNIIITGNPDAAGSHPDYTNNLQTVVEVKTRGAPAWYQMEKIGPLGAFPSAIAQLAFYRMGLLEKQATKKTPYIHPQSNGILVNFNTDTKEVKIFSASNINLTTTLTDLSAKLSTLTANLLRNDDPEILPERDYDKTDWQCKFCPFFNECYKDEEPPQLLPQQNVQPISRADAINSLHQYETAGASTVRTSSTDKETQETARKNLLNFLQGANLKETTLPGATGLNKTVRIHKKEKTLVDLEKLSQLLTPKDYNDVVKIDVTNYIRIT